ncbi:hypothetical protein JTB14_012460 [Gonioctena quinquepunctata]|nr:hypothetical protein JTB14_012460 [Gonioctena quinquepunctata]
MPLLTVLHIPGMVPKEQAKDHVATNVTGTPEILQKTVMRTLPRNRYSCRRVTNQNLHRMFTALSAHVKSTGNDWFLDSGCSAHLTVDKSNFISEETSSKLTITTANDQQMETNCDGDIQLPVTVSDQYFNVNVKSVFYVPDLKVNLLSVSQIVQKGNKVNFNSGGAQIINARGKIITTVTLQNNLFKIDRPSENAMLTLSDMLENALLWHKRMGHVNFPNLNKLKNGLVHGIKFHEKIPEGFVCEICATTKNPQTSERISLIQILYFQSKQKVFPNNIFEEETEFEDHHRPTMIK